MCKSKVDKNTVGLHILVNVSFYSVKKVVISKNGVGGSDARAPNYLCPGSMDLWMNGFVCRSSKWDH